MSAFLPFGLGAIVDLRYQAHYVQLRMTASMSNQRRFPRTPMKCRIKICHPSFGELFGYTRDLSDGGVYVRHPALAGLPAGTRVSGQVQDLPIEAPVLQMEVMRGDGEGAGLRFVEDDA